MYSNKEQRKNMLFAAHSLRTGADQGEIGCFPRSILTVELLQINS